MALEGVGHRGGLDVPDDRRRVFARGDEEAAVGRELRAVDRRRVASQRRALPARPQVEEVHGAVGVARRERAPVGGQRAALGEAREAAQRTQGARVAHDDLASAEVRRRVR
jgi:hypothetical protein